MYLALDYVCNGDINDKYILLAILDITLHASTIRILAVPFCVSNLNWMANFNCITLLTLFYVI